ncbi:MAG: SET domain-containing protein-lysine N-methyltransferase, partial [Planctomycetia bacterium]|nr:SET domain-containing protein-lysine N-methyltransferase [Planctomycetia bacterium]
QTMPWLTERYGSRLRQTNFDEMMGPSGLPDQGRLPTAGGPVELRSDRLGRTIFAVRDVAVGETILRTWGRQLPSRTRHSMQVDDDVHVLPDGPIVFVRHSCEPNCGVLIRSGVKEIEMRALRPIAAGEELTLDYDTFEHEIGNGGGECLCGSSRCRGRVAGYKHLAADVRARYGEFIAEYLRLRDTGAPVTVGA